MEVNAIAAPDLGVFMEQPQEVQLDSSFDLSGKVVSQETQVHPESASFPIENSFQVASSSESSSSVPQMNLDTLMADTPVSPVGTSVANEVMEAPQNSGMLSLDEMIAQPVAAPVASNMDTLNADVNPLTSPVVYPGVQMPVANKPVQTVPPKKSSSLLISVVMVFVVLIVGGGMMFVKYPDLVQNVLAQLSSPVAQENPREEPEHAAATTGEISTGDIAGSGAIEEMVGTGNDDVVDMVEVTPDESMVSEDIQDIVLDDESGVGGEEASAQQESTASSTGGSEGVDSLSAVEDLVGPISNTDTLSSEISAYKAQAQNIADTGKAQGNRAMVKWGIFVVNQVEKVEQELANGGNMTISEWTAKKAELDISLAKANEA